MKITTKTRYGLRTVIEIALQGNERGVFQKDISQSQEISNKYLDQIIASLKASGLIMNSGGKKSGYILSKPSSQITLYDIYRAFESDLNIVECTSADGHCQHDKECASREFWCELNRMIVGKMESVYVSDLAARQKLINEENKSTEMYFI